MVWTVAPWRCCIAAVGLMALAGCAMPHPGACLLPTQKPMLSVDLYFGRDIAGRAALSDAEWADFAARVITPQFPGGFTVLDASGQWLNPQTGTITQEPSKLVRAIVPAGGNISARVKAVSLAYRQRFHQLQVGIVSAPVCAAL